MVLNAKRQVVDHAPILFPSRHERCSIFTALGHHLEYRSLDICGKRYPALIDDQASLNIMSAAFVKYTGLVLCPDNTALRLSDGSICYAIGLVYVQCKLSREPQGSCKLTALQTFYVLKNTFTPLVLGIPFLREASLFHKTCSHHILPQQITPLQRSAAGSDRTISNATWCLKVVLVGKHSTHEAIAMPDSGASLNLMSLEYAEAAGFHVDGFRRAEIPLTIGNGQTVLTMGKVRTIAQLHPNLYSSKRVEVTFFVVKGLVADLVLGRHFSRQNHLCAGCKPCLMWILIERDIPGCFVGGKDEGGYKVGKREPSIDTVVPKQRKANNAAARAWDGPVDDDPIQEHRSLRDHLLKIPRIFRHKKKTEDSEDHTETIYHPPSQSGRPQISIYVPTQAGNSSTSSGHSRSLQLGLSSSPPTTQTSTEQPIQQNPTLVKPKAVPVTNENKFQSNSQAG